jgi:hypothetical protein
VVMPAIGIISVLCCPLLFGSEAAQRAAPAT